MSAPLCARDPRLFDSTKVDDHLLAARICQKCPILDWCREYAVMTDMTLSTVYRAGIVGTWAGVLHGSSVNNPQRLADEEASFSQGQALAAHAAYVRGARDEWSLAGERTFQRRAKRKAAAS